MTTACESTPGIADAYRRQARRLRCRYAGQPDRLQPALRQLAATTSIRASTTTRLEAAAPIRTAERARTYADYLSASMPTSGILRYSQRLAFLRAAPRFGLNRFEANLAIAAVLQRRRASTETDTPRPAKRFAAGPLLTFAFVQGVVLFGAWWSLFR